MTKNYALFLLNQLCAGASVDAKPIIPQFELAQALNVAIKALGQQPCEDCISREATVKRLCQVGDFMNEKRSGLGSPYIMAALFIQDNKDEFPSVTPTRPTGKWIEIGNEGIVFKCSLCGMKKTIESHFCPNCGAKMQEVEE